MRLAVAALALLSASPVEAHCYSIWNYNKPQHCGVGARVAATRVAAREEVPMPASLPAGLRDQPDIAIPDLTTVTVPPDDSALRDDMLRALAIEELKKKLANGGR